MGPGDAKATTVLAVAPGPLDVTGYGAYLKRYFERVREVATLEGPYGVHNQEWRGHIYVCTGPFHSWGEISPDLRHYD